jgi:hypothetical protein
MTVEDEHVYHVGKLNLLAHNEGCLPLPDDGIHMNTDEALDTVEKFLGPSYFSFRDGRFILIHIKSKKTDTTLLIILFGQMKTMAILILNIL